MEKQYLEELMRLAGGKPEEACRMSGLPRSSLYDRLKKHGVRSKT